MGSGYRQVGQGEVVGRVGGVAMVVMVGVFIVVKGFRLLG